MIRYLFTILVALTAQAAQVAQAPPAIVQQGGPAPKVPTPKLPAKPKLHKPVDAVNLAPLDLQARPDGEPAFIRYLWVRAATPQDVKAVSLSLNWLSSALIHQPPVIGGGDAPLLVRVDLRQLAYTEADLQRWIRVWEELAYDPSFNLLFTYDSLLNSQEKPPGFVRLDHAQRLIVVASPPYVWSDGKTYREKWHSVLAIPRPSLGPAWEALVHATGSQAPVVESDYFINRALGSLRAEKDNPNGKVYDKVFGGLYYDFAGVRTAKEAGKKKATDLDVLFEDLGIIDDADGPITAQIKLDRLGSEQRVAMVKSGVTGKPRMVAIIPTLKSVRERGVLFLTHDPKDESVDILDYPFADLLDFKGDAFEGIWVDRNGSQKYVLFNRAGQRQSEVPFNIANDSTVPAPYTQRLHTISCITCHGPRDGWQPLPNNAAELLPSLFGMTRKGQFLSREARSQVVEKYHGDADQLLAELRRGTMATALRATGLWPDGGDQTGAYRFAAAQIAEIRRRYWFSEVDAGTMLRELGYDGGEKPAAWLANRLPLSPLEDVRIKQLKAGKAIQRAQAETLKGFLAERLEVLP